jgi:3-isopropylmalate/(R)-2-methylmalate dehydratase small subunit
MEPLTRLTGVVAPLLRDNVDTDAIIPAAFMRSLSTDPASGLFARWRYRDDGSDDPTFVLNEDRYRDARILLSGANFGCGSSRENAVWALQRHGIRCVIALGFSDIFRQNALKNGVLPIALPAEPHARIVARATAGGPLIATIDVRLRAIEMPGADAVSFELEARQQARLLSGRDEIEETLNMAPEIERFRARHRARSPWLYGS